VVPRADGELETYLTLVLADQNPALAEAHDELYPERIVEAIPLSVTLLYPFATRAEVDRYREELRAFLAAESPFGFELAGIAQWEESGAVYAVPKPEQPLRDFMRRLWRRFPEFPPYREADADPPPHASLTYKGGEDRAATRARVERWLDGLLPAPFSISEVALMEEAEADRWRLRETFRLGA
jgi:2'-5' RNA ligase